MQRQDLASTAPGVVGKRYDRTDLEGQRLPQHEEIVMLEESLPDVVLLQHRDVRDSDDLGRRMLPPEIEGSLQDGKLAVDRRVGSLRVQPPKGSRKNNSSILS